MASHAVPVSPQFKRSAATVVGNAWQQSRFQDAVVSHPAVSSPLIDVFGLTLQP